MAGFFDGLSDGLKAAGEGITKFAQSDIGKTVIMGYAAQQGFNPAIMNGMGMFMDNMDDENGFAKAMTAGFTGKEYGQTSGMFSKLGM